MTTTLVEKVRWPIDSAGSLLPRFDKYGFVRRFVELDAAIKALFAAGEPGAWYDPSDIAVASGTLLGSELITNGDLSAGTTGWTPFDSEAQGLLASISVVNGRLRVTNSQSFQGSCYQYLTGLTVGKTYRIEVDAYVGTAPVKIEFFDFYSQPTAATNVTSSTVSGKLVLNAVATNTGMQLNLYVGSSISGQYAEYDNITVKEVTTTYSGGTLFQDAAGTTPVTAVEQPVGLMLDKSKGLVLGSELFSSWQSVTYPFETFVVSGNTIISAINTAGGYGIASVTLSTVIGKWYFISGALTLSSGTAPNLCIGTGDDLGIILKTKVTGNFSGYFVATTTSMRVGLRIDGVATNFSSTGFSVRELPGNHATQTTSTSRPVLSARYNLLTKTEQFDDAAWVPASNSGGVNGVKSPNYGIAPDGTQTACRIRLDVSAGTAGAQSQVYQAFNATAGTSTIRHAWLKTTSGSGYVTLKAFDTFNSNITVTGEWTRFVVPYTPSGGTGYFQILTVKGVTSDTADILVWHPDVRVANDGIGLPAYQRVNTATDYDTSGFPHYLRFDGVDDFLVTNSINFTATDKMFVSAGVRKLSDAAGFGIISEFGDRSVPKLGSFAVCAPQNNGTATYYFASYGSTLSEVTGVGFPSPITNILTGIGDISGDRATLRINGTQVAQSTADQGTGNYGNYPLYIGRRGGTTLPFNGHLYSLTVRGAQSTDQQIIDAETYINSKTKAYA